MGEGVGPWWLVSTHCSHEVPASRPNQQLLWHVFETFAVLLAVCVCTRPQGRLSHAAGLSFSPRLSAPVSVLADCWRQALLGSTAGGLIGVHVQVPEGRGSADEERRAEAHSCRVLKPPHPAPARASPCAVPPLLFQFRTLERVAGMGCASERQGRCGLWVGLPRFWHTAADSTLWASFARNTLASHSGSLTSFLENSDLAVCVAFGGCRGGLWGRADGEQIIFVCLFK